MEDFDSLAKFFFGLSGLFFFIGLLVHSGAFKTWWLLQSTPVTPVGIFLALIPSSLLFLVFGILIYLPIPMESRGDVAMLTLVPIMLVIFMFATLQPRWLKPKWLHWMEKHHDSILSLLQEEAHKEGWQAWNKRVKTQEGLEEWVAEVRRKHNLPQ